MALYELSEEVLAVPAVLGTHLPELLPALGDILFLPFHLTSTRTGLPSVSATSCWPAVHTVWSEMAP